MTYSMTGCDSSLNVPLKHTLNKLFTIITLLTDTLLPVLNPSTAPLTPIPTLTITPPNTTIPPQTLKHSNTP